MYPATTAATAGKGGRDTDGLGKKGFANYGYGDREDMIGFINEGKKMRFDEIPRNVAGEEGG